MPYDNYNNQKKRGGYGRQGGGGGRDRPRFNDRNRGSYGPRPEGGDDRRSRFMKKAKRDVTSAYVTSSQDHAIIQGINAYNELEKVRNILYERLEEWYGGYFPNVKMTSHETFAKLISRVRSKDVDDSTLEEILGDGATKVSDAIKSSLGFPEMGEEEYSGLKAVADEVLNIIELQKKLDKILDAQTKKLMPNITYLIDYKIAAEMLAKAGSLERFANMPASTIQLLGAERALFKHLKFGGRPPKYGYLFKLPELATVNKKEKGRMARIYATKISIASRADAYSHRFIADKLKESLDKARARNAGKHETQEEIS